MELNTLFKLFGVDYSDPPNVTEIVRQTGISYAHTCKTIIKLEKEGLLKTNINKKHKRVKLISLTPKGVEIKKALEILRRNLK